MTSSTICGRGARRDSAAAIASAQASGVWKFGTPARPSMASASGASGTRNAASGLPAPAHSMIGRTVTSGLRARRRAEHRQHEIEFGRGQQDVERRLHGVVARARDREIDQPRRLDLDARGGEAGERRVARALDRDAAARQRIDHHGGAARRGGDHADRASGAACRGRIAVGTRASSGSPSISASSVSTRAMPHSARNTSATSSSPASAPVWETASSRAAAERPSL